MRYYIMLLLAVLAIAACRKQDDYKRYISEGELLYTGRADSMRIHPGRNRVQVSWLLIADPKVKTSKLYWNNRKDSAIIPINRTKGIDTIRYVIDGLDERTYEFEVVNVDHDGNLSMVTRKSGVAYGELYETSLLNRAYEAVDLRPGKAVVRWNDVDSADGIHSIQLQYTNTYGSLRDTIVKSVSEFMQTELPDISPNTELRFRTRYLPDSLAIDTFLTAWTPFAIGDIEFTQEYVKNPGKPFQRASEGSDRFAQLADWLTNDEAKRNGTTDEMNGADKRYLTLWIWGNGTIINGKIWQTITLPRGTFRMEAFQQNVDGTLQATYFTVTAGNSLPDVEQIGTALASKKLTDNSDNHHAVEFTLQQPTAVSLGFVGTFIDPIYQTLRIEQVKLFHIR